MMTIKNKYNVHNLNNYLLEYFLSISSHFFSVSSVTFSSSSSWVLALPQQISSLLYHVFILPNTLICSSSLVLHNLNLFCLFRPFSSPPFHLSPFIFLFTALAFFWFLCLHAHHKCFFQNLSQSADLPFSHAVSCFEKKHENYIWVTWFSFTFLRERKENKKTPLFLLCSLPWNFIFLDWSFSFLKKLLHNSSGLFSYNNSETDTALGSLC